VVSLDKIMDMDRDSQDVSVRHALLYYFHCIKSTDQSGMLAVPPLR